LEEVATEKLRGYKSRGTAQIAAQLLQAGGNILRSEVHKIVNSTWNKKELLEQWKESIVVSIHNKGDKTDYGNYPEISAFD
jgi:hypothetical protein